MPDLSVSNGGVIPPVSSSGAVVGVCSSEGPDGVCSPGGVIPPVSSSGAVVGVCSSEGPDGVCSPGGVIPPVSSSGAVVGVCSPAGSVTPLGSSRAVTPWPGFGVVPSESLFLPKTEIGGVSSFGGGVVPSESLFLPKTEIAVSLHSAVMLFPEIHLS